MRRLFQRYRKLEADLREIICAEVFIQLINAAFFISFLLYMQEHSYSDGEATAYFKYRFLGVLALAFPLGRLLRGRPIRPYLYVSAVGLPLASLASIYAVRIEHGGLLVVSQLIWGVMFMCMQVPVLPYIMRNASLETRTAAISLSFSTWSFANIIAGVGIFALRTIDERIFTNERLLQGVSILGIGALFFLLRVRTPEKVSERAATTERSYDWPLILRAMLPTMLLAVGAGLTIPFMPLFFANIHGFTTSHVAIVSAVSTVIVLFSVILTPWIKDRFGYRVAIPCTQLAAIAMLVGLALTEYIAAWSIASGLAILMYVLRQPLMNLAGPMTSELTMSYVGSRNQELVSALTASIWSGSWFLSGFLFQKLREGNVSYANIFFITAALYLGGVVAYIRLILDHERRSAAAEPLPGVAPVAGSE